MKAYSKDLKIGVLGGGQLGKMLYQPALDLDLNIHFMDPAADAPCSKISPQFRVGDIGDYEAVHAFGQNVDVITIEIEKVNTEALKALEAEGKRVYPQPNIIELIQDKRKQKAFYKEKGIPTSDFILTDSKEEVKAKATEFPVVNKVGKGGYDGRGVQVLRSADDLDKAFEEPSLLESFVPFQKELAVIVARNPSGEIKAFPPVEMVFHPEHNLVEYLLAPAMVPHAIADKATKVAHDVIEALDMVGLLAVEMFLTKEGEILVNEVAPRPHNSGHQSIESNFTSQYEQCLRAILDLPLGDTRTMMTSAMINVLGEDGFTGPAYYQGLEELMQIPGAHLHLYGKSDTKPFRKMGHITLTNPYMPDLLQNIEKIKNSLKVKTR